MSTNTVAHQIVVVSETENNNTTMENTMSIKEIMEEIEKLKARVKELEDKSN